MVAAGGAKRRECGVCGEDVVGFVVQPDVPCTEEHAPICRLCLGGWAKSVLLAGKQTLPCPFGCAGGEYREPLTLCRVFDGLGPEAIATYTTFLKLSFERSFPSEGIAICPTADCGCPGRALPGETVIKCTACGTEYCVPCGAAHAGMSCDAHKEKLAADRSQYFVDEFAVRCPRESCRTPIIKRGGCNAVTCSRCSTTFCYACETTFDQGSHNNCYQIAMAKERERNRQMRFFQAKLDGKVTSDFERRHEADMLKIARRAARRAHADWADSAEEIGIDGLFA